VSGSRRRKSPPKPIHLLYGILALAALGWFAFYLRGGCRKPELDAGQRFEKSGEWDKTVERYQALLRRYPNDHEAAARIADIQCLHLGNDEQCLAWTTRLLEIYPGNRRHERAAGAGLLLRGRRLMNEGDRLGAETALLDAARYLPDSFDVADLLRELYQATGDGAKADVWRAKADALAPK